MLEGILQHWNPRVPSPEGMRQSGALPYAIVDGQITFLLITSRHTGRWIFPKGGIGTGLTPWDSAAREALEEAGVSGVVATEPVGSYRTAIRDEGGALVDVDLFPLRVEQQLDEWQEMDQRLRHWAILPEVRRLLADRSLSRLADRLSRQLLPRKIRR